MAKSALVRRTAPGANRRPTAWMAGPANLRHVTSGWLAANNGVVVGFGKVKGGTVLGQITVGGRLRPCVSTAVATTANSATQELESVENVSVGDPLYFATADVTANVTAIDTETNEVTLDAAVNATAGEAVTIEDGSSTPVGVCLETVTTLVGVDPDDHTLTEHTHVAVQVVERGTAFASKLIGATTEVIAALEAKGWSFLVLE